MRAGCSQVSRYPGGDSNTPSGGQEEYTAVQVFDDLLALINYLGREAGGHRCSLCASRSVLEAWLESMWISGWLSMHGCRGTTEYFMHASIQHDDFSTVYYNKLCSTPTMEG